MPDSPQPPNRPSEMPAVKTTIVGGRPPGSGTAIGTIPRGIEILLKKAAVDPQFKALLLEKRSAAAAELELTLAPAEAAMLDSVPTDQLEAIIAGTKVPEETRRKLLGKVTAVTLAALGAAVALPSVCLPTLGHTRTLGIQPDHPASPAGVRPEDPFTEPEVPGPAQPEVPEGAKPELPGPIEPTSQPSMQMSRGVRPDRPGSRRVE